MISAWNLARYYRVKMGGFFRKAMTLKALDGVFFSINKGKTLAVVGASGCGKSTLAHLVTMIERPMAGQFEINGIDGNAKDKAIRKKLNLADLLVPHDLSVVRQIAGDRMVMYLGRPVEQCDKEDSPPLSIPRRDAPSTNGVPT